MMPMNLFRRLNPDLWNGMKVPFQFDDLYLRWAIMPIVMPANNTIALFGIMAMSLEAARAILKLNPNQALLIANASIRDTVRKMRTDLLDAELFPAGDLCKQKDYAEFILRGILKRGA